MKYYFIKGTSLDKETVYSGTWKFDGCLEDLYDRVKENLVKIIGSECVIDQISYLGTE